MSECIATLLRELDVERAWALGECQAETREALHEFVLPEDLFRLDTTTWPQMPGYAYIGNYCLYSSQQLNSSWVRDNWVPAGFFPIGEAANGDTLAIDLLMPVFPVIVMDHSRYDGECDPFSISEMVANSLEDFLDTSLHREDDIPGDYRSAVEYFKRSRTLSLREVLQRVDELPWNNAVYLPRNVSWDLETVAIVWDPDDVDDDSDEEPAYPGSLGMRYVLGVRDVQGIVSNLLQQRGECSIEDKLRAFLFYCDNAAFIELD